MANSIIGIPSNRISDVFVRQQLLSQIQTSQAALYRTQMQLSTGHRFQSPSDDPVAALAVTGLQSLLERKAQVKTNINSNQSFMRITDSTLSGVSNILTEARGTALSVIGTTYTDAQRQAAALQISQAIQELVNTGNQKFNGRYLFAGSSASEPFAMIGDTVRYAGNDTHLPSYSDVNLLFDTNVTGNEVFGAISAQVQGSVKITPVLTYDTRLADLRQGLGISKGSILVSDGANTSTIDISGAETIGDLAALIHAHPPAGRELNVDITADRIIIQLDRAGGGNLSIREVGSGTVADELGIRRDNGVGNNPITGRDLEPVLRGTNSLANILGAYANTVVHSTGRDNDIVIRAKTMGATTSAGLALNDVQVVLVDDPAVSAGHEFVDPFDGHTLRVHIDAGYTRAINVVQAINNGANAPFTAEIDPTDDVGGGQGLVEAGAAAATRDGRGEPLDRQSGLQITNGGETYTISFALAETVEDLLNAINANTGLLAQINQAKDGIDIRSRTSGSDFMIAENGGRTAAQLGVRSFCQASALDDLNYGRGVGKLPEGSSAPADFTITRTDGVQLQINIANAKTIGDVLALINNNAANADGKLAARLNVYGNGIELVDSSAGPGTLTVTSEPTSDAAVDLGLIPSGSRTSGSSTAVFAATLRSAAPKSGVIFTAKDPSVDLSGATIEFDSAATGVTYDPVGRRLTIGIIPGATTAANVVEAVNRSDAAWLFHAELDPTDGNPNDGSGRVDAIAASMAQVAVLDGRDVNQKETTGVFTALLRLKNALENNNLAEMQRAMGLLDNSMQNLNFVHAEVGARQQALDIMADRLDTENIELKKVLSDNYDADLTQVVSDLAGQQTAFQAALQATASIMRMSLLDYL